MKIFIPRAKLSKKRRAELDAENRQTWRPGTSVKRVESAKRYSRAKSRNAKGDASDPESPV